MKQSKKNKWTPQTIATLLTSATGFLVALYQIIALFVAPRLKPTNLILKAVPASQNAPVKPIIIFWFILLIGSAILLIYFWRKK